MITETDRPPRFVRERECRQLTGLSRSTRWRLERSGQFPRRCRIARNSIGWLEADIRAWVFARALEHVARAGSC